METLQEFIYLILYAAVFMVAVSLLFIMLGTSQTKDVTVSADLSDKTSITMSGLDEPQGYGRNNVTGEDKTYTKNQQKKDLPLISSTEVYMDILAVVDNFTPEELEKYANNEIKITIRSHPISYNDVLKIKNKNEAIIKNLDKYIQGADFQRMYQYDKDLNVIAVNYQ